MYQLLDKPTVSRRRVVEGVCDVSIAEVGLVRCGSVRWNDIQVVEDAVDKVVNAINKGRVPDLSETHFNGYGGDAIVNEGRFDATRLTRINLEGVGLEQLRKAFNVGEAEIGVAPEGRLTAGAGGVYRIL